MLDYPIFSSMVSHKIRGILLKNCNSTSYYKDVKSIIENYKLACKKSITRFGSKSKTQPSFGIWQFLFLRLYLDVIGYIFIYIYSRLPMHSLFLSIVTPLASFSILKPESRKFLDQDLSKP